MPDGVPSSLSQAQLEIMNVIWSRPEMSVTEVWDELSQQRPIARNTVLTTLTRLEDRGWLTHRTLGKTFLYRATIDRETAMRSMLRRLADAAFDGSTEGLVLTLLQERGLDEKQIERIHRIIRDAEGKQKR